MNSLGICRDSGAIYEGASTTSGYRVDPAPFLTPIRLGQDAISQPVNAYAFGFAERIFREEDFDPVTRIRRGSVFTMRNQSQPWDWYVQDPIRKDLAKLDFAKGGAQQVSLITYHRDPLLELAKEQSLSKIPKVLLGWEPFVTLWKLLSIENSLSGTPLLTLKAIHSLGDLPELVESNIPQEIRAPFLKTFEKVETSINRLTPIEVIDRCRDAFSVVFGFLSGDRSKDLTTAINAYVASTEEKKENLLSHAARIVARLHSRGKPNEQHDKGLRPPSEDDAQLATRCFWTVLVELNWAR